MSASSRPHLPPSPVHDVTCPFCGLACDDLVIARTDVRLAVQENGCPIAKAAFPAAPGVGTPRVAGREVPLAEATASAARLLAGARYPLFGGLGTDVAGARAIGRLAERCGGVLDHMNSAAMVRNLRVLQETGWMTTTLAEVRNRCDLLVVAGGDLVSRFPRLFERTINQPTTLFADQAPREVVFLGRRPSGVTLPGTVTELGCDPARLAEAIGYLRALLRGRRVEATTAAGLPADRWRELATRMRAARYGVLAWAAGDFEFPHAELAIQGLADLVTELNRDTRWSGLPLAGSEGDLTADSVHLWQTGYGVRVSFATGIPEQDLHHHATARLLERGEADVLVWVSSYNPSRVPPPSGVPTIVLGHAAMRCAPEPAVFIPVGTPGLDHAGHFFRTDRIVALPLTQLRPSALPSVAEAMQAVEAALPGG